MRNAGDDEFIHGLYENYEQMLYRVAFNILHNCADAEDAVQETFVRVIRNLEKIRAVPCNETRFYLVIIVRNVSITMLNRKKRRIELDIDEQYDLASDTVPEEELLSQLTVEEIRRALNDLSTEDCEVLWLLLFRELSANEIAEMLGLKPATVRSRICRARRRLIRLLEDRGIYLDGKRRAGETVPGEAGAI